MLEFPQEKDPLTERIIGCAIEVHRELGPGLLESIYEAAMAMEFNLCGIKFSRQAVVPVKYKGEALGEHRIDFIVENTVVLELKSVERFDPVFEAQVLTYLRLTGLRRGLLLNFNSRLLKDGIRRYIH
jgi:GxxExxY protein